MVLFVAIHYLSTGLRTLPQSKCAKNILRYRLRTRMVECSWIAIKKDPGLNKTYQAIKMRRGGKRAIVAVSRKLIIRIRRILLDEVTYRTECATAA
jgi:ABC-type uncharacterized transport system YnjBCD ATPase subunit